MNINMHRNLWNIQGRLSRAKMVGIITQLLLSIIVLYLYVGTVVSKVASQ